MTIRNKQLYILVIFLVIALQPVAAWATVDSQSARAFVGNDLYLAGKRLISYQLSTGEHTLVFSDAFSMSIGANKFSSDSAVVWLETVTTESRGRVTADIKARVYLAGNISTKKGTGAKTVDFSQTTFEENQVAVIRFSVSGGVFVTADKRENSDPRGLELYKEAEAVDVPTVPVFVIQPAALVPGLQPEKIQPIKPAKRIVTAKPAEPTQINPAEPQMEFMYPVNISPAGSEPLQAVSARAKDGTNIATVTQRLYVWQKRDEKGTVLELQADNAVIFYSGQEPKSDKGIAEAELAGSAVKAIYMSGDILMTEGPRTIAADEIYYDFQLKKAMVVNAVMRNFDAKRAVPIYVRAAKLRRLAENKFAAENITLTTSEFYKPQISLTASDVIITDTTAVDAAEDKVSDNSFNLEMHDVRIKAGDKTIFRWPFMRSNMLRPDVPLKGLHVSYDSTWGPAFESRWYLSRLLGLKEPEGTDNTFMLDYYGKRGLGTGVEIDYKREDYFGGLEGYIIHDTGEDKLGRDDSRRNLEPSRKLRGRLNWRHRQFLPYNWQLTTGLGYASDENFVESYYGNEFNTGEGETYIHLKRVEDNWGLSFLGKTRLNDFEDVLEELPSAEFHLTGQSLFDNRFTLYSDTQASRLRQRIGNEHSIAINENRFTFLSHRTEIDMPLNLETFKIVPFAAGTLGYDDRSGFTRTLVDGSNTGAFGDDSVWIGEAGVRVFPRPFWKIYPDVKSRLWDLDQLRHVIKPELTAVFYEESDNVVKQRDALNLGLSQLLQTTRGPAGKRRRVDWMRLDMDVTWVKDPASVSDAGPGPDRFMWNKPIVPLRVLSAPGIFNGDLTNGDLHKFEMFGPRRNYFAADYLWRLSDTTAVLSDMNFDMQSGVVQQFNIGLSRLCWPNFQFYVGSRYLRRVEILDEKGSNAVTFAATYILDPRYTLIFGQQFDFDYGANVRSDITLIRRYHRVCWGFTFSTDQLRDEQRIVFSIWPQGISELAVGPRKYINLGGSAGY